MYYNCNCKIAGSIHIRIYHLLLVVLQIKMQYIDEGNYNSFCICYKKSCIALKIEFFEYYLVFSILPKNKRKNSTYLLWYLRYFQTSVTTVILMLQRSYYHAWNPHEILHWMSHKKKLKKNRSNACTFMYVLIVSLKNQQIFYLPNVIIQVQNGNEVINRSVPCQYMDLA